jgi:hypothetical protein
MLSTAAVWLLLGRGRSPSPLPAGPITKPPGPTASCVLNPVSMPLLNAPQGPPLLLPAVPAAAAAAAAVLLLGQKSPGGAGALQVLLPGLVTVVAAPATPEPAPAFEESKERIADTAVVYFIVCCMHVVVFCQRSRAYNRQTPYM